MNAHADLRRILAIACNAAVAVLTAMAWAMMTFGWGSEGGSLSSLGTENLKYFTVLSNVFSGVVAAVVAVRLARGDAPGRVLAALQLAAVTSVALTFLTVAVLFGAVFGVPGLFGGANFWFHLVLPLLAIAGWCALAPASRLRARAALAAVVPMALYGACYYANILANGAEGNDWYGFTAWGMQAAPVVFAAMAVATWAVALALWAANRRFGWSEKRESSARAC